MSSQNVERSPEMLLAGYYLARCGVSEYGAPASPPAALEVDTWKAAYDLFFDPFSDGRSPRQFRNSLKNTRDTFDGLFENGRQGWKDRFGKPSFSPVHASIHETWKWCDDSELEECVFKTAFGADDVASFHGPRPKFVRTEGGKKVYVSTRLERDPDLREKALEIHGTSCMACDFNFSAFYGKLGDGFAEVHHCVPLSESGVVATDPHTDLAVLCANCHRMVHRKKAECLSVNFLRELVAEEAGQTNCTES